MTTRWAWLTASSLTLLALIGFSGVNAAVPPIGDGVLPILLNLGWPSGLVTVMGWAAVLFGAAAVWVGMAAVRQGEMFGERILRGGPVGVALLGVLVPALGSADHLSYLAYGRITQLGGDPYAVAPSVFPGDPVISGVQPPWSDTTSVYGPVATGLQALASWLGSGSLRASVFWWQVLVAASYLILCWALSRLVRTPAARTRVAVLVTLNPLLIMAEVFGAHIDLLAMVAAVLALLALPRSAVLAGVAVGVAACIKLPYAALAPAFVLALWPSPHRLRQIGSGIVGALAVVVPGHLWAGPHVFDQTRAASAFTSLSSPWRAVANLADLLGARSLAMACVPVVAVVSGWLWWRCTRQVTSLTDPVVATAVRWFGVFTAGWLLAAPYVLPWYDILLWVPLALLVTEHPTLERLVLARTAALAVGYVPGRIVGMSPMVESVTLAIRSVFTPMVLAVVGVGLLLLARRSLPGHQGDRQLSGPR